MGNVLPNPEKGTMEAIIVRIFVGAVTSLKDTFQSNPLYRSKEFSFTQNCGFGNQFGLHAVYSWHLSVGLDGSDYPD